MKTTTELHREIESTNEEIKFEFAKKLLLQIDGRIGTRDMLDWLLNILTGKDAAYKRQRINDLKERIAEFDKWCEDWEIKSLSTELANYRSRLQSDLTKLEEGI